MDLELKGKKAIVTGGSKGIGRAVAETLTKEGADVAICARNEKGGQVFHNWVEKLINTKDQGLGKLFI